VGQCGKRAETEADRIGRMSVFDLQRIPEAEVMDDWAEVEAYSSAAAQTHLDAIDNAFVEHAVRLVRGREGGRVLDIGTGPGQIMMKLARRLTRWSFLGVDRSANMIAQGVRDLSAMGGDVAGRVEFQTADGNALPFTSQSFDLVMCNSVLHHLAEPQKLLGEMARLVKPDGAILLRDLRRPGRFAFPLHVRWHGRSYSGEMLRLYRDSVRAAYTTRELKQLLESSTVPGGRVFQHGSTHIGIERSAA
jgi:ubiquinone/menaquinone biosynthesis C-methylase UbiE